MFIGYQNPLVQFSYIYVSRQYRPTEVALYSEIAGEDLTSSLLILHIFFLHQTSCVLSAQTDCQLVWSVPSS